MFSIKRELGYEDERGQKWYSSEKYTTDDQIELEDLNEKFLRQNERLMKYFSELQKGL